MNAVADKKNNNVMTESPYVAPEVNIYENPEGYVLQAEMPGVSKEGLEIVLEGNTLVLVGRRQEQVITGTALYRETRAVNFRRVFELDPAIDTNRISAEMRQGLLILTLPKAERAKPRKVEIK